jgi:uncharacterized protein with PQ loop repeat
MEKDEKPAGERDLLTTAVTLITLLEFGPLFQAWKSVRSQEVNQIAPLTYAFVMLTGSFWLAYGIKLKSFPLIFGNAIKLFSSGMVIVVWLVYRT